MKNLDGLSRQTQWPSAKYDTPITQSLPVPRPAPIQSSGGQPRAAHSTGAAAARRAANHLNHIARVLTTTVQQAVREFADALATAQAAVPIDSPVLLSNAFSVHQNDRDRVVTAMLASFSLHPFVHYYALFFVGSLALL